MAEQTRFSPRLLLFTDATRAAPELMLTRFAALAERAQPGSVLLTLRDYHLATQVRWALAQRLAMLASRTDQGFGVADRADWARALGAMACHLSASGLSPADARRYLGPDVFLSQGSHDASWAADPELDAVLLSPIFEPRKGREALGLAALARLPGKKGRVFALGGVAAHNAAACLTAGASGVAVIGAALAPDPAPLLRALGILRR